MNPKKLGVLVLLGAGALLGCNPPKYVNYWSIWRDWSTQVPWGWDVRTDQEASTFAGTNLTGPFAPEFYLGVPSFSVRWYQNNAGHLLRNGLTEFYKDGDDFIAQMLDQIYPGGELVRKEKREGNKLVLLPDPVPGEMDEVLVGGVRKAKRFIVAHEIKAPVGAHYGVVMDPATRQRRISRLHEYVVLQLDTGFYVLVYPATANGYDLFYKQFHNLVAKFHVAKEGPSGPPPPIAGAPAAATN